MKRAEFIAEIEAYYGNEYNPGQLPYLTKYLSRMRGTYLQSLFDVCIRNFSAKWRTPPDIAIFEGLKEEAYANEERKQLQPNEFLRIEDDDQKEEPVSREQALKNINELRRRFGIGGDPEEREA